MIFIKRIYLLKESIFSVFFVLFIFLFTFTFSVEASVSGPEAFLGEKLNYNVGFWLFRKSASGSFSFKKHQKGYEAIFEAQTAGFLKLIMGKKIEYMRSVMEYDSEKKMFRTLIFEETFKDGAREAKKEIFYDYGKRVYEISFFRNGKKVNSIKKSINNTPVPLLL